MKKIILIGIGIIIFLIIVSSKANKTTDKSGKALLPSPTATIESTATDEEREIFYKYHEHFMSLPTVPIKDESRHNKAISLTAEEFNISTGETEKIYEKVTEAKPSDKEIEIYEALDAKLDEAVDNTPIGKIPDEKAVDNQVAKQYGISTAKLNAIYILVLSNTEYQKQQESKIIQEKKERQIITNIENRKKILDSYTDKLNEIGMNQLVETVSYKYADVNECSIVVKVRDTWHYQLKQIRLQEAQNLWEWWSKYYYLEEKKDECRMEIVDLNGNNVGGSSWLGGSVVNVKD